MKTDCIGLYIHWPYCLSKCPYCGFFSRVEAKISDEILYDSYARDLTSFSDIRQVGSIFFGGGTPSLMSPELCDKILSLVHKKFSLISDIEITMEANPDAIMPEKMSAFSKAGVNRLSVGVQSMSEDGLKQLGRRHTLKTALQTIERARKYFPRLNMDLIYARPGQTASQWEEELAKALALDLEHYSLYQLSIEEGTPFHRRGIPLPSEETAAELYTQTNAQMAAAGKPAYEISNYARPGAQCRHNLIYWRGGDYAGIGPAAHGRIGLWASSGPADISAWVKNGLTWEKLSVQERNEEKLLMGLRLIQEGFSTQSLPPQNLQKALQAGWIHLSGDRLFLTQEGILMLDRLTLLLAL